MSPYPEKTTLKPESAREQQGRLVAKGSHFSQSNSELKKTLNSSNRIYNEHAEVKKQAAWLNTQFCLTGISSD
jgi:hypothetical protein